VVPSDSVDEPNDDRDDFDRDITDDPLAGNELLHSRLVFTEVHEAFLSMMEAGFSESQALRFLAFCSIYDGDF
jgi:hypothetical protein